MESRNDEQMVILDVLIKRNSTLETNAYGPKIKLHTNHPNNHKRLYIPALSTKAKTHYSTKELRT